MTRTELLAVFSLALQSRVNLIFTCFNVFKYAAGFPHVATLWSHVSYKGRTSSPVLYNVPVEFLHNSLFVVIRAYTKYIGKNFYMIPGSFATSFPGSFAGLEKQNGGRTNGPGIM